MRILQMGKEYTIKFKDRAIHTKQRKAWHSYMNYLLEKKQWDVLVRRYHKAPTATGEVEVYDLLFIDDGDDTMWCIDAKDIIVLNQYPFINED